MCIGTDLRRVMGVILMGVAIVRQAKMKKTEIEQGF
jgi:hypothetical protein